MKHRKLRIAWSIGWGVLCLMLIALWVQSYSWASGASYVTDSFREYGVYSDKGWLEFYDDELNSTSVSGVYQFSQDKSPARLFLDSPCGHFQFHWTDDSRSITIPTCLVILFASIVGYSPWFRVPRG
jgi:hypothetical protein